MNKSVLIGIVVLVVGGFAAMQFLGNQSADKDAWPKGTKITCIVPWKAGGSADTMARQLAKYWEPVLGTNIIIDNRPGAATLMGTELFLNQPDDGSYIYIGTQMYMSAGVILQNAKFRMEDFEVINFQQFDPITVAVHEDSPYKTLDDLIKDIKARPGEVKCGLVYGGAPHLGGLVLAEKLGLQYKDVTYDSGNGYRTALLGKHVDFVLSNANGDRAIQGKARVLAVADDKRSVVWPDAPTFNEALAITDFPKLGSARFIAVRASLKTKYPERYAKLVQTYKQAFEHPDYVKLRQENGESEVSAYRGPEESNKMNKDLHNLLARYKSKIDQAKQ